jgi:molybdopterin converting factor subunit 1
MRVRILLFSVARDLGGFGEREMELPESSTARGVMDRLAQIDPRFEDWGSAMSLAVNQEYVADTYPLRDGDEVAVIPPVSGG